MNGLAGCYGDCDGQTVRRMLDRIKHRGPDSCRIIEDDGHVIGSIGLARHRRLKPICIAEEDGVCVAADSYIFNKRELVTEYFGPGAPIDLPDVELLIEMYRSEGFAMFGIIDGAYAVSILDGKKLLLARDRLGIKPLYFAHNGKSGSYSSEMKSQVVDESVFEPFPPGKLFIEKEGMKSIPRLPARVPSGDANPYDAVRRLLLHSTDECIENSDYVNILLSGGIDSSAIAAAASLTTAELDTACVGTEDSEDLEMARRVAEHLGTHHVERVYDLEDMVHILDEAIYAVESFDYPLVRNCVPNYLATHLFLRRNRVTLMGDGGDEIFAGAPRLQTARSDAKLRNERRKMLASKFSTGFQRVDRMCASAFLDGRLPFLQMGIIDLGLSLGRKDLIGAGPNEGKLVVRRAFEKLLPKDIAWRKKQKFSMSTDSPEVLKEYAEETISDREFQKERKTLPKGRIRTKEELLYFRSFQKAFHNQSCYDAVGLTEVP